MSLACDAPRKRKSSDEKNKIIAILRTLMLHVYLKPVGGLYLTRQGLHVGLFCTKTFASRNKSACELFSGSQCFFFHFILLNLLLNALFINNDVLFNNNCISIYYMHL